MNGTNLSSTENQSRINATTCLLFSQVFQILNNVTKRIEDNFYVSLTDGKRDLLLQISDFQSHLEALKSYVDCREQSRSKLEMTVDYLRNELKKLNDSSKKDSESNEKPAIDIKKESKVEVKSDSGIVPIEVMEDEDGEETEEDEEGEPIVRKKRKVEADISEEGLEKRTRRARRPRIVNDFVSGSDDDVDYEEGPKPEKRDSIPAILESKTVSDASDSKYNSRKRGKLPNSSTSVLKKWILQHWFHPYPSEEEKSTLCSETHLTITQLNNWFTNARRRLLKRTLESKASELFQQYPKPDGSASPTHPMAHYPHSLIQTTTPSPTSPKENNSSPSKPIETVPSPSDSKKSSIQNPSNIPPPKVTNQIVSPQATVIPFTLSDRVSIPQSAMIPPNSIILASYPIQAGKSAPPSAISTSTVTSSSQDRSSLGIQSKVNPAVATPIATQ